MPLTPNSIVSLVEFAVLTHSPLLGQTTYACMIITFDDPHPSFLSNHLVNMYSKHLVNMYSKLDLLDTAQLILQLNPSRSVVTWFSLVASSV
ncbi:hypothetical protein ACFX15_021613 [Malus domestica]